MTDIKDQNTQDLNNFPTCIVLKFNNLYKIIIDHLKYYFPSYSSLLNISVETTLAAYMKSNVRKILMSSKLSLL